MNRKIILTTLDKKDLEVKLKNIKDVSQNFLTLKFNYRQWLKTGISTEKEYQLMPESLSFLLKKLENTKYFDKLNLNSSYGFLKLYPTNEKYLKELERLDSLPVDEIKLVK